MKNVKNVRDFLKADSVVPQMVRRERWRGECEEITLTHQDVSTQVSTYNRRKQGVQYLQSVLGKLLNNIIADDFDLEL